MEPERESRVSTCGHQALSRAGGVGVGREEGGSQAKAQGLEDGG